MKNRRFVINVSFFMQHYNYTMCTGYVYVNTNCCGNSINYYVSKNIEKRTEPKRDVFIRRISMNRYLLQKAAIYFSNRK
jgi:predicted P-loop ATPase/GTPase